MLIFANKNTKGGENMCCSTGQHQGFQQWGVQNVCHCGCDFPLHYRPHLKTKAQRIAALEQHLSCLREETKAVEEHLAQIKQEF